MHSDSDKSLDSSVLAAFFGLNAVGIAVGVLAGGGMISGAALAVFILGAVAGFVLWAIWRVDPEALASSDAYKKAEADKS